MVQASFHQELKELCDGYVHTVYDVTLTFPKEELFGVTSQLRRSTLSIILNYIEGYARRKKGYIKNFLEISYGSLKESEYLVEFASKRGYLSKAECEKLKKYSDRIGAMLWGTLDKLE